MEIDIAPGRGLVGRWTFKIMLLAFAIMGFIGTAANTHDRLQLASGVPGTIQRATERQAAPTSWSLYEGSNRAVFDVKVTASDGRTFITSLFLPKKIVEDLLDGGQAEIVFVKDNPPRFLLKGDPLPPYGIGWLAFGIAFLGVFLFSLRLR